MFGPIAVVLAVADEDEAVRVANEVRYGLVGSVFTRDLDKTLSLAAGSTPALIRVNAPTSGVGPTWPRSGARRTPAGPREQGKAAATSTPRPGRSPSWPEAERWPCGGSWWTTAPGWPRPGSTGRPGCSTPGRPWTGSSAATPTPTARAAGRAGRQAGAGGRPAAGPGGRPAGVGGGVTFLRSRDARLEESSGLDAYDKVYLAERPELFLKALPGVAGGRTRSVRADSDWDVPEPELAVVADRRGRIVAYTIGDDVSSRSIEREPSVPAPGQAVPGQLRPRPCLVPVTEAPDPPTWRSPWSSSGTRPGCSPTAARSRT